MRVLAFASQKSGAGKTTLAGHIAVQAQRAGLKPVVLVDVDPDASLTDWFALRAEDDDAISVAQASLKDLPTKLQQLRSNGVQLVVIDTPPACMGRSTNRSSPPTWWRSRRGPAPTIWRRPGPP
ncbi:MAG: ParA family protein, partial [Rhodospirillales bacterium]|nr:ParA family protein [Rhodospirillales bacterium]